MEYAGRFVVVVPHPTPNEPTGAADVTKPSEWDWITPIMTDTNARILFTFSSDLKKKIQEWVGISGIKNQNGRDLTSWQFIQSDYQSDKVALKEKKVEKIFSYTFPV